MCNHFVPAFLGAQLFHTGALLASSAESLPYSNSMLNDPGRIRNTPRSQMPPFAGWTDRVRNGAGAIVSMGIEYALKMHLTFLSSLRWA
jgi:hypothetical protein